MLRRIQRNRQKHAACLIDNFQVPAAPIDLAGLRFLAQFLDGLEGLIMRSLQIRDLDTRLVQDSFVRVHKVEVAMHSKTAPKTP